MSDALSHYSKKFGSLRTASSRENYPLTTHSRAPHKPLLLLAILDLFEQGTLTTNFVPLSPDLTELFASYWDIVMPSDHTMRLFLPFFHLKNDGFWHLIPQQGKEVALDAVRQIAGSGQLHELVLGGQFDAELYTLLHDKASRDALRMVIIQTYFDKAVQPALWERTNTHILAFEYSEELIAQARTRVAPIVQNTGDIQRPAPPPVRDQGFRKAIVRVYDHRCVLCGVRLVTVDGRTAATAAHIIPWSVSHNDDPRNGLCLCRLCHWAFDVGLATISGKYRIRLSGQINESGNMAGYLSTLNERPIFEPTEEIYNPDIDALNWHTKEVFLG